ncbi:hypothetical protein EYY89_17850 [Hafnia paralvei]|uniref:Uncharacterized protein n=1 Tax=Hafnia paralvei TaxID=546367 RepID=A0A4Q9EGX8_9GAMM|nr:hypothetical protein EYY89_17850 [Hafnia paralvei]
MHLQKKNIICYGMGITQHEHGTQNVQQLVNLLLLDHHDEKSGIPAYKSIPIEIEICN